MSAPAPPPLDPRPGPPGEPARRGIPWRILDPIAVALIAGSFLPGEIGEFMRSAWALVPLVLLGVIAQHADRSRAYRVIAVGLAVGLCAALVLMNALTVLAVAPDPRKPPGLALAIGSTTLAATAVFGTLGMVLHHRRSKASHTAPHASRWVHGLAATFVAGLTAALLVPLASLGATPLSGILASPRAAAEILGERGVPGMLADELYTLTWTLAAAAFVVGYGSHRDGRQVLARLGLTGTTWRTVAVGLSGAAALLASGLVLDPAIAATWTALGWPQTDLDSLEPIFGPLSTPLGAAIIGVCAGLGEEVSIRGILQPRIGILSANLFFTALHAYQYHWDGLLGVFLIGLVLAGIRHRWNTTAAAVAHGAYNFTLLMQVWLERGGA